MKPAKTNHVGEVGRELKVKISALLASPASGAQLRRELTALIDAVAIELFESSGDLALVALGSYSRRELCPFSDIDIWVLYPKKRKQHVDDAASAVWYPLWDAGLELGHSVRSVRETLALARDDFETSTSVLEVRHLAGNHELTKELVEAGLTTWQKNAARWSQRIVESALTRERSNGDVAFFLEPDLKNGKGGLRDFQSLAWISSLGNSPVSDLVTDQTTMAYEFLLDVRTELHRTTGKKLDKLLLQEQDRVAEALGEPSADALMMRVSSAARYISSALDEATNRLTSRGYDSDDSAQLRSGVELRSGSLLVDANTDRDVTGRGLLEIAAWAASAGADLPLATLVELEKYPVPDVPWKASERDLLIKLLGSGQGLIPVWEALDLHGIITRLLPAWEAVRCRPQRNAYHTYTVDRHLLEVVVEAGKLVQHVSRPDLLLLGALLHDIGKGSKGPNGETDHSIVGMGIATAMCELIGLPEADTAVVRAMVELHLLLPDIATRRDIEDPATAEFVADKVKSPELLELLDALTESDSLATGPAAWSPWKKGLVSHLVNATMALLRDEAEPPGPAESLSDNEFFSLLPKDDDELVLLRPNDNELLVIMRDRDRLLASVTGALAALGVGVHDARVATVAGGWAVDRFVLGVRSDVDLEAIRREILSGLNDIGALRQRVARRERDYASSRQLISAVPARTGVTFDRDFSALATVAEVRARDEDGLLFRITDGLAGAGFDVVSAKVTSIGHQAVDTFYLRTQSGAKLGPVERKLAERAILAAVGVDPGT